MKWFRMYYEARNDAKLDILSDAEHRIWFRLLCFAAEQEEHRGTIRKSRVVIAAEVAKGDMDLLERTIRRLADLEILSVAEDGVAFIHFAPRNYDKPSDLPEATRERQQRHRHAGTALTNEDVTPVSRDVTRGHATETELESELLTPRGATAPLAPKARKGGSSTKKPEDAMVLRADQRTWVALRDALGYEPHDGPGGERGAWNKAIEQLRLSGKGADDVGHLVKRYRELWPKLICTPNAIVAHLGLLGSAVGARSNGVPYLTDEELEEKHKHDAEWERGYGVQR